MYSSVVSSAMIFSAPHSLSLLSLCVFLQSLVKIRRESQRESKSSATASFPKTVEGRHTDATNVWDLLWLLN